MNERIKELSHQAHAWAVGESKFGYHECRVGSDYFLAIREQKFAELIVQECAQIADDCVVRDLNFPGEYLKDHFGVE